MKEQFLAVIDDIVELIVRPFVTPLDTDRERFQWNVGKSSATVSLALLLLIVWCLRFPLPGKGQTITLSVLPAGEEMQTIELPLDQGDPEQDEEQETEEIEKEEPEPEQPAEPVQESPPEEAPADTEPVELPAVDQGDLATHAQPSDTNSLSDRQLRSAIPPPGSGDPYNRSGGGLAQSNLFAGKTIVIYSNCPEALANVCGNPRLPKLLNWMGFDVKFRHGRFQPSWLSHADQLWIFAGTPQEAAIDKRGYQAIEQYIRAGKPTYLCAENAPYTREVWVLGHRLMKKFKVGGSYTGGRLIKVASSHPIFTGIQTLYEGDTIAKFQFKNRHLTPLLKASNGDLLVASSPPGGEWKLVIDGGWTRYYPMNMQGGSASGAGTELYVTNLAAWLAGANIRNRVALSEHGPPVLAQIRSTDLSINR